MKLIISQFKKGKTYFSNYYFYSAIKNIINVFNAKLYFLALVISVEYIASVKRR